VTRQSSKVPDFHGQLDVVSTFELGQFLLLGRKTGALHLIKGDEKGVLYSLDGRIVSAIGPDLRGGLETAKKLLAWSTGEFEFIAEPVAPSEEIELGTETLLLETARQMDESGVEAGQVAASLETVDELSKTFAALAATGGSVSTSSGGSPVDWITASPGRHLMHVAGHGLSGIDSSGKAIEFDGDPTPDPGRILSQTINSKPCNDWILVGGKRLFLSWSAVGYRLIHPYPSPQPELHLSDNSLRDNLFRSSSAAAIYGPPDSGRSLLMALMVNQQIAQGSRVVYLTGLPSHDLGDGKQILHVIQAPGKSLVTGYDAIGRWQPDWVAIDLDPSPGLADFIKACRSGGIPLVMTLQAPLREWAQESIRLLAGESSGWEYLSPKIEGSEPKVDLVFTAA